MSKKIIKLLSLIIAVMMITSAFVGCSKDKKNDVENSKEVKEISSNEETVDNGYIPAKDLELTMWYTQGTDVLEVEKPKEDIPGDWLIQKTRVKINEFYGNGGQQWEPKLTTLIASGNLPHLIFDGAGQGPVHQAKLHEGDLNWELKPELIQKYAPDVWRNIPEYIWEAIKVDGGIYGIPFFLTVDKEVDPTLSDDFLSVFSTAKNKITSSGNTAHALAIRDDILKKLIPSAMNYDEMVKLINEKQEMIGEKFILPIKTTDEYIKFMYDIKALGLKEGNKPVYAFGYDGGDSWLALSVLGPEMLGYKHYWYTGFLNIPEKRMDFGYLNPTFREAAKIQNKMLNDKVIDPESLVHNAEKFKEKVMNGQYAITSLGYIGGTFDTVNSELEKAGKSFRFVPFYTQVEQREEFPFYKEGPPMFNCSLAFMKTLKEDEVPQVLNWINTMFTEEWEEIRFWGTKEAGLYEDLPDGSRRFKDEKMQRFLVDNDISAMDWKDAKGLNFNNKAYSGGTQGFQDGFQKWTSNASIYSPKFYKKDIKYITITEAMKFPASGSWCQGLVPIPNVQSWSAEYANIPEVKELWSTRATWDDPFKVAFTAKNEDDFNKKWDAAIENFRKTIDVDKMLEKQTKIMLPLLEKRTQQAN